MTNVLISREGYTIGVGVGADFTPLDYMLYSNPKTAVFPRGFRQMLLAYPLACAELKAGGKVCGFRMIDIMEGNFNDNRNKWNG